MKRNIEHYYVQPIVHIVTASPVETTIQIDGHESRHLG